MSEQKYPEPVARPPCTCGERDVRERDYRRCSDILYQLEGSNEQLHDERDRLREAAVKAREALQHLRHCVSCGEGDWRDCYDGGRDALAAWQALDQVLGGKP